MKAHTTNFKNQIQELGREIDSIITFGDTALGIEELNAVTPSFQGGLLKSVMKQLDIDSNVDIPIGTELNYKFGVKVNGQYEYLDFGNYIVYSSEKQEDTLSYKIVCYDKMLKSMVDYENLALVYPITIRNYLNEIAQFMGVEFANKNQTFTNYNKEIPNELFLTNDNNSLNYTFRDVLDQLAQVVAGMICINKKDELEVRYVNETNDTIDENFLKDVNVSFGEKYGPINSIVLSRSGESDNVYIQDGISIETNGLHELKIIDNQIMNFNDRSDYLAGILEKLNGLEFYINDFTSTGVCYYDLYDKYNVQVNDKKYSCIMFNDEILVTQGLQENVFTDMPEETQTDYTKADKTDRKINQTYLIVDKQNQKIESVVSQTNEQNNKIAKVTQTVEELNSKITEIADITTSSESVNAQIQLFDVNQSEPIRLVIRPIEENISYLYPHNEIYPAKDLHLKNRKIRFENTKTGEIVDYELPYDLLYYDKDNYDEFILDYDANSCVVNKRVYYNDNGTTYPLGTTRTIEIEYPHIPLTDGDYKISILGYTTGYIFARLMVTNIYTTQFATKAELSSEIKQTQEEINMEVSKKVGEDEIISKINQTAEQILIDANKVSINGIINAVNNNTISTINGNKITTGTITADQVSSDVITTKNFQAQQINANNITSGTLSADKIDGGTIKASNIILQGVSLGTGTSTVGGWNASSSRLYSNSSNVASSIYRNGNVIFGGNYGMIKFDTDPVRITTANKMLLSDSYSASTLPSTNDTIALRAYSGTIHLNSNYGIYANSVRLDGSSSKKVKKNIKLIKQEYVDEIFNEVDKMPIYTYDYIEKYGDNNNIGFVIEDIEETCLKDVLKITQNDDDEKVKNFGTLELNKLNLLLIKELIKKNKNLEKRIKKLEGENK